MRLCALAYRFFAFCRTRKRLGERSRKSDGSKPGNALAKCCCKTLERRTGAGTTAVAAAVREPSRIADTLRGSVGFPDWLWIGVICDESALRAFGGLGAGMEGFDDGGDAAAGAEVAGDFCPDRVAGFDYVVKDLVDDVLLE